jgi:hypothetical protein
VNQTFLGALLAGAVLACPGAAHASAARTFVASTGTDANTASNCAATLPCRSFGAALSVTGTGGEIIVLSSGGYGTLTIAQSVTITAPPSVYAGISVASGNGITISGSGISVALKGLTINGIGGANGIYVGNAAAVDLEGLTISNFASGVSDAGIYVAAPASVKVVDTTIRDSVNGVYLQNGATVTVDRTRFLGTYTTTPVTPNTVGTMYIGVYVNTIDGASTTTATVSNCYANDGVYIGYASVSTVPGGTSKLFLDHSVAFGGWYGVWVGSAAASSGTAFASVKDSMFSFLVDGLYAAGSAATIEAGGNTFHYDTNGFDNVGTGASVINSFGDNAIAGSGASIGTVHTIARK